MTKSKNLTNESNLSSPKNNNLFTKVEEDPFKLLTA